MLHWVIAILVIANWRIAESAENLPDAERLASAWRAAAPHVTAAAREEFPWRAAAEPEFVSGGPQSAGDATKDSRPARPVGQEVVHGHRQTR